MKHILPSRLPLAALCCAGALIAAACASTAPQAELAGTRWQVVTIGGDAVGSLAPTLEFQGDRIAGSGGCNRFFGAYRADDGSLSFSGVGRTEMACEPGVMQREDAFFQALESVERYDRLGDTLMLNNGDGAVLTLRPA